MSSQNPKSRWYLELLKRFHDMAERVGITGSAREEVKEFILAIAKEQYLSGNRSGISWMRKKQEEKAVMA